ncbi:hypothetical protein Goari_024048 [Gossypium aridum]|uniref:Uncharacterized protein n=1 Tax=Gossypium aridum TaxID=34290 RepID=A0A7J8X4Y0_GOSAI|nr:hypothetical protein [Gossypium aridum]
MVKTLSTVGKNSAGSNNGVGRATKKVKHRTDVPPDLDGPTVDRNGQVVRETNVPKDSYKTKLLGAHLDQNTRTNMKEIFELQDGNVATEVVDGVPSITFSNRVH